MSGLRRGRNADEVNQRMKGRIINRSFCSSNRNKVIGQNRFADSFETITKELKKGNSIEIRGFGTFEVIYKHGQTNKHNPKTGEKISDLGGYFKVRFRPGKILNKLISSQEYELNEKQTIKSKRKV